MKKYAGDSPSGFDTTSEFVFCKLITSNLSTTMPIERFALYHFLQGLLVRCAHKNVSQNQNHYQADY